MTAHTTTTTPEVGPLDAKDPSKAILKAFVDLIAEARARGFDDDAATAETMQHARDGVAVLHQVFNR